MSSAIHRLRVAVLLLVVIGALSAAAEQEASEAETPALEAGLFSSVEDRTAGVRPEERAAVYRALQIAGEGDRAELITASRANVERRLGELKPEGSMAADEFSLYLDLLRRPETYRGELVYFDGRIRRIDERAAEPNEQGIETVYEAWLYPSTEDASPVIVLTTVLPEEMPTGEHLSEPASVAGYFFKLQAYSKENPELTAPVLVAHGFEWRPLIESDAVTLNANLWNGIADPSAVLEPDPYYFLLAHAKKIDYGRQQESARRHLAERREAFAAEPKNQGREYSLFVDMFQNPAAFRGELVTVRGHIRKLETYPANENHYGIEQLHELWLFPPDSQSHPVVVITTSIPDDLPRVEGRDPVDHVWVTGYFFKNYIYTAEDARRVAPMILAQRVDWQPVAVQEWPAWVVWGGLGLLVALLAALIALVIRVNRKDRAFRAQRRAKGGDGGAGGFAHLSHGDSADVTHLGGISPSGIDPHQEP